jgi:hypothetical protein
MGILCLSSFQVHLLHYAIAFLNDLQFPPPLPPTSIKLQTIAMTLLLPFMKELPSGQKVIIVRASAEENPATVMAALDLPQPSSLLMLSGGAGLMSKEASEQLEDLFNALGQTILQEGVTVIDGGTQSGVVTLMGRALSQRDRKAPYIGILPAHAEVAPGGLTGEEVLEPHHSHFVLVDSQEWGGEVKLMYGIADHLSAQVPSLALLVNGGGIALQEIEWNVRQGREIIVLAGSGRLADEIASAKRRPDQQVQERIASVVRGGHLTLFDLSKPVTELTKLVRQKLLGEKAN